MNVIAITGDYWHPTSVSRPGLEAAFAMQNNDHTLRYIESGNEIDWENLQQYAVIILMKGYTEIITDRCPPDSPSPDAEYRIWLTPSLIARLTEYLNNGGGLLVIHSGLTGYQKCDDLCNLIGGVFRHHPPGQPHITISPTEHLHPITNNITAFTAPDELYFCDLTADVTIILQAEYDSEVVPAGWIRTQGHGRICVLTPGHTKEMLSVPQLHDLINRAVDWCGNTR